MTVDRQDDWGDDGELGARLESYAESHLEPDPAATARTRAVLMVDARRILGAAPVTGAAPISLGLTGPGLLGRLFRRPALAATAALLGLAVVAGGTVAASGPGGPLYGARLWVETLTLPSDTTARAAAELDHLQARLDDATAAAANGNGDAVTAALDAYRQTLADASSLATGDPSREQHLIAELGRHQAVLEALLHQVPTPAAAAIREAVERTQARIDAITPAPGKPVGSPTPGQPAATPDQGKPGRTPNPGGPNPTATPGGVTGTPKPGNPGHTPDPGKPNGSPRPGSPDPTPQLGKPDHTPNPGHSPNPGGPAKSPPVPGG
jgi:Domain of unknown function (DUF5667)